MNKPIPKEVNERIWNLFSWHIKRQMKEKSTVHEQDVTISPALDKVYADPQTAMDFAITYYSYFEEAVDSGAVAQGKIDSIELLQTQSESVS